MARRCIVPGCQVPIVSYRIMCIHHWRRVPAEIRRDWWDSQEITRPEHGSYERKTANHRYGQATRAALDAVRKGP